MPQHPRYDADPSISAEKLSTLMSYLLQYGILHEDSLSAIERAMEMIHRRGKEDDDDCWSFTEYITNLKLEGDEAHQFVQDLRNAINIQIVSDHYIEDDAFVEMIIADRDLEYYKSHCLPKPDKNLKPKKQFSREALPKPYSDLLTEEELNRIRMWICSKQKINFIKLLREMAVRNGGCLSLDAAKELIDPFYD